MKEGLQDEEFVLILYLRCSLTVVDSLHARAMISELINIEYEVHCTAVSDCIAVGCMQSRIVSCEH